MSDPTQPKGIYSSSHKAIIGSGMTRRATVTKKYWAVYQEPDGSLSLQPLNQNLAPTGQKRPVAEAELAAKFTFEPDFYVAGGARPLWQAGEAPPAPEKQRVDLDREPLHDPEAEMDALLARRRAARERERRDAEDRAEQEARAGFGLAVSHLKRGERTKALQLFEKIIAMDAEFAPRHKHMFNEFGMGLRKSNLPDLALKVYRRALELAPFDDHIYHNMARILFEQGETGKAVEMLHKSLEINPALDVSRKFLDFIEKKRKKLPRFSI